MTGKGIQCRRRVNTGARFCWQHSHGLRQKWRSLTQNQSLVFILGVISVVTGLVTWRYPDFWKSNPVISTIQKPIADKATERIEKASSPAVTIKKSGRKQQPPASLRERALQLETAIAFFGVTRQHMLKELTFAEIPRGGYSPEDVPGNREIEAQTLQLFQKEFLPQCIEVMSEFRGLGFNVETLRQRLTAVSGAGPDFMWIADELKLLATQLDSSTHKNDNQQ